MLHYNHLIWNFNSIKVQLKHIIDNVIAPPIEFQFHKGTIKTDGLIQVCRKFDGNFNSIKVQLKPDAHLRPSGALVFQFHKGTIKTRATEDY